MAGALWAVLALAVAAPRAPQAVRSSVVMKTSKRMAAAEKLVDKDKVYDPLSAVKIMKEVASAKFPETAEAHIRLNLDPKYNDQQLRTTVALPKGTGNTVRVAVLADGPLADQATAAGADLVGMDDLVQSISSGTLDFDVLIATPPAMPKIAKLGRVLGPKGLMPSPKAGTVTTDVGSAVADFKSGKFEFRCDKSGIVHVPFGKCDFSDDVRPPRGTARWHPARSWMDPLGGGRWRRLCWSTSRPCKKRSTRTSPPVPRASTGSVSTCAAPWARPSRWTSTRSASYRTRRCSRRRGLRRQSPPEVFHERTTQLLGRGAWRRGPRVCSELGPSLVPIRFEGGSRVAAGPQLTPLHACIDHHVRARIRIIPESEDVDPSARAHHAWAGSPKGGACPAGCAIYI